MKSVTYEGPHAAVEVSWAGVFVVCDRGAAVDVPADVAKSLIEGGLWKATKSTKKPAKGKE